MKKLKVPYVEQSSEFSCGAAALEMIYRYHGLKNISEKGIFKALQKEHPEQKDKLTVFTDDLVFDARNRGFIAYWDRVDCDDKKEVKDTISKFIKREIPLIVCQQSTLDKKLGHFRVVIGIDDKYVYFHDPDKDNEEIGGESQKMEIGKFIDVWRKTGKSVTGGIFVFIF